MNQATVEGCHQREAACHRVFYLDRPGDGYVCGRWKCNPGLVLSFSEVFCEGTKSEARQCKGHPDHPGGDRPHAAPDPGHDPRRHKFLLYDLRLSHARLRLHLRPPRAAHLHPRAEAGACSSRKLCTAPPASRGQCFCHSAGDYRGSLQRTSLVLDPLALPPVSVHPVLLGDSRLRPHDPLPGLPPYLWCTLVPPRAAPLVSDDPTLRRVPRKSASAPACMFESSPAAE